MSISDISALFFGVRKSDFEQKRTIISFYCPRWYWRGLYIAVFVRDGTSADSREISIVRDGASADYWIIL